MAFKRSRKNSKSNVGKKNIPSSKKDIPKLYKEPKTAWKKEPNMKKYYHVTDSDNLEYILDEGLFPSSDLKGVYVTNSKEDAFNWGLQLQKEEHIKNKPVILKILVPSNIKIMDDPKTNYLLEYYPQCPLGYVLITDHVPKDFIEKE